MNATVAARDVAIVTASYAPDFERCRLLCETVDRHLRGFSRHYILVEHSDYALFRQLESERRTVVSERDLLPGWLHSLRDPTSLFRRRIWLSLRTKPLRGWHVQQLRRIAIAGHASEAALLYCDSDVAVLRDFDCASLWHGDDLRLFRRDGALLGAGLENQKLWSRNAGLALGIDDGLPSPHDYIATFIAWRRDATLAMCRRIEDTHAMHWVEAVASTRHYSECMLYGRHADEVLGGAGHFVSNDELCRVYWNGPRLSDDTLRQFIEGMEPDQVAIGLQSFVGTDIGHVRELIAA